MATYKRVQTKAEIRSTISTSSYKFATGKSPKGAGFWFFEVTYSTFNHSSSEEVCYHGSYTQAVNQVVDHVNQEVSPSRQVICIKVMS